jgi:hypothetical protein
VTYPPPVEGAGRSARGSPGLRTVTCCARQAEGLLFQGRAVIGNRIGFVVSPLFDPGNPTPERKRRYYRRISRLLGLVDIRRRRTDTRHRTLGPTPPTRHRVYARRGRDTAPPGAGSPGRRAVARARGLLAGPVRESPRAAVEAAASGRQGVRCNRDRRPAVRRTVTPRFRRRVGRRRRGGSGRGRPHAPPRGPGALGGGDRTVLCRGRQRWA